MIILRWLLFTSPAWVVAGILWLGNEAGRLRYRSDSDLVVAVRELPRVFNPLLPSAGDAATREITEMLFDHPFRRDDELKLRAHLVQSWQARQKVTFFFSSVENAALGAEAITGAQEKWKEWGLRDAIREEDRIHAMIEGHEPGPATRMTTVLKPEWLAKLIHVRLTVKEAVSQSLGDFLSSSVEKGQIQLIGYDGDRIANLYLLGETDLFLKELRIYYESNLKLEPVIDVLGNVSTVAALELGLSLREDAKWHDGTPVTADDLVFSFREVTRSGSGWPQKNAFDFVASVEKTGDYTLLVALRDRFAPMLESWEKLPVLPWHLLRDAVSKKDWDAFFRNPVGNGPFRLEPSARGDLALSANASYFLGQPRQPRIVYRRLANPRTRHLAVKLGQVEAFFPDEPELVNGGGSGAVEWVRDVPRVQNFVVWNLDRGRFADGRVREGLARSVDLDQILKEAGKGRLNPWGGLFFPGIWYCPEGPELLSHDASRAAELMKEGGWKHSETGWLDGDYDPVEFRLTYDPANDLHAGLAAALARAWEQAGIRVVLEPMEWQGIIAERLAPRDFDALMLGWELGFGRDQFGVWHSSRAGPGGSNLAGLKNQVVDELVSRLRVEEDESKIAELARDLQRQVYEMQPFLFLGDTGTVMGIRRDSMEEMRPREDGAWLTGPPAVERSGLYASRPWWVRADAGAAAEDAKGSGKQKGGAEG